MPTNGRLEVEHNPPSGQEQLYPEMSIARLAARVRRWSFREYLATVRTSTAILLPGLAVPALLHVVGDSRRRGGTGAKRVTRNQFKK